MSTSDPAKLTRQARRTASVRWYSRLVRMMKIALPICAMLLIGLIFLSGRERGGVVDLTTTKDAAALAAGLELDNPRFAGVTENGEPYVLTATTALPDGAVPNRIDLNQPVGEITLSDARRIKVTSPEGRMFRKDEMLDLSGGVVAESSDGYRLVTDHVEVDIGKKTALAPGHLLAEGPRGSIEADHVRAEQGPGEARPVTLWFTGNVRVVFIPKAGQTE